MKVCERNSCVCVTITTRDAVIGEQQLKCEREQITKVIESYAIAVKKGGIIVGHLL